MDADLEELMMMTIIVILMLLSHNKPKIPRQRLCTSSLTGKMYMRQLLDGPSILVYGILRMNKYAFIALCGHFRANGYVTDSKHVDVEEKMAIFLKVISHRQNNRLLRNRFQHSGSTISRCFREVLRGMLSFAKEMIVPPNWDAPVGQIRNYRSFREGPFKGALGAMDGTLIPVVIPSHKQIPYRARGGKECYQNVLGICDFDMKFTYVVAGWEGIAHDSRVLAESIRNPKFKFPMPPPDKYYLCDAGYAHTKGFMAPFRGKRYWLGEFRQGGRARDREEKFNHVHSQLRNVIERTFGVLKQRFDILEKMRPCNFSTQKRLVIACMAMHNFLRRYSLDDELFLQFQDVDHQVENPNDELDESESMSTTQNQQFMIALRNQIADTVNGMIPT